MKCLLKITQLNVFAYSKQFPLIISCDIELVHYSNLYFSNYTFPNIESQSSLEECNSYTNKELYTYFYGHDNGYSLYLRVNGYHVIFSISFIE